MPLAAVPLRAREDRPALLARVHGSLDAAHPPSSLRTVVLSLAATNFGWASRRLRLAFFLPRMWVRIAWRARSLPPAVLRKRFLAPECVFIFGIDRLFKQTSAVRIAREILGIARAGRLDDEPVSLEQLRGAPVAGDHRPDA